VIEGLEKALEYAGGSHTLGDVLSRISSGHAQLWESPNAVIVTEVYEERKKRLHFWLAAGEKKEVVELSGRVLEWGKSIGCVRATLAGRKGWLRALRSEGWRPSNLVLLERQIDE
jgi:hypothetical protein